jgi:hypothetical protein
MRYEDDPAEYARRLEAKLSPHRIRATLAFSGLYQLTHEQIKRTVLDDVKSFFGYSPLGDGTWLLGESGKMDYEATLLWAVKRVKVPSRAVGRTRGRCSA